MRIVIPRETDPGEHRVAATPATVARLVAAGFDVIVQAEAGVSAGFLDQAYRQAGADIETSVSASTVDVLLHVAPPHHRVPYRMRPGSFTVGLLHPADQPELVGALADADITSFAVERAGTHNPTGVGVIDQGSQVLTGYEVLRAALQFYGAAPGAVVTTGMALPPSRVLIIGGGVTGLQSADLFRKLGARVTICDCTASTGREAAALAARFVELLPGRDDQFIIRQQDVLAPYVADADIVVGAAAGNPAHAMAPLTATMIQGQRPGSVVIDTAGLAESLVIDQDVTAVPLRAGGQVTVVPVAGAASQFARSGTELVARALVDFVLRHTVAGEFAPDIDHPVVASTMITTAGTITHPDFGHWNVPEYDAEDDAEQLAADDAADLAEAGGGRIDVPQPGLSQAHYPRPAAGVAEPLPTTDDFDDDHFPADDFPDGDPVEDDGAGYDDADMAAGCWVEDADQVECIDLTDQDQFDEAHADSNQSDPGQSDPAQSDTDCADGTSAQAESDDTAASADPVAANNRENRVEV